MARHGGLHPHRKARERNPQDPLRRNGTSDRPVREFATLLHVVNRGVGKGDDLAELMPANGSLAQGCLRMRDGDTSDV